MATHEYAMSDYSTVKQFCNLALERTLNARAAMDSIPLSPSVDLERAISAAYQALEAAEDGLRRALEANERAEA